MHDGIMTAGAEAGNPIADGSSAIRYHQRRDTLRAEKGQKTPRKSMFYAVLGGHAAARLAIGMTLCPIGPFVCESRDADSRAEKGGRPQSRRFLRQETAMAGAMSQSVKKRLTSSVC